MCLTDVHIPNYVIQNSSVQLGCDFDLENDTLYSVRWYKDDEEFFRYMDAEYHFPRTASYQVEGIHIDVSVLNEN